jgi:signal transduction histidine kinase
MRAVPFVLSFPSDEVLEGLARRFHFNSGADQVPSGRHGEFESALNERLRLARELHDGLLQSLTAAALQLEVTLRLVDENPRLACERLREIQELIVEQQRELRTWIERARNASATPSRLDLRAALEKLFNRVARWGPHVESSIDEVAMIPPALVEHVYRLIEESLSNVVRHARASVARIAVGMSPHAVLIAIEDDGCGFRFYGRYDLVKLNARRLGPVSLKERVALLHGDLVLTSSLSGSRLEFILPIRSQPDGPTECGEITDRQVPA